MKGPVPCSSPFPYSYPLPLSPSPSSFSFSLLPSLLLTPFSIPRLLPPSPSPFSFLLLLLPSPFPSTYFLLLTPISFPLLLSLPHLLPALLSFLLSFLHPLFRPVPPPPPPNFSYHLTFSFLPHLQYTLVLPLLLLFFFRRLPSSLGLYSLASHLISPVSSLLSGLCLSPPNFCRPHQYMYCIECLLYNVHDPVIFSLNIASTIKMLLRH